MFKPIPGNTELTLSLSQEFRDKDGMEVILPRNHKGQVTIELYGSVVKVCPMWLSQVAHFELDLPNPSFRQLLNLRFYANDVRFFTPTSSRLPVFLKPMELIHLGEVFRVIPTHSRYAVSSTGELIEISTRNKVPLLEVNPESKTAKGQYPSVFIYDPDRSRYRYVYIHRLVALSWVKNRDESFVLKPVVNHKDSDKTNFNACNLEWCSFKENSYHCYNSGTRNDNMRCAVRDFETRKVYSFISKSQAADYMGISKTMLNASNRYLREGKLIKDRYEFRLEGDNRPWFYESREERVKTGRYVIVVIEADGQRCEYFDVHDFKRKYGIWNTPNVHKALEAAKVKYPEYLFEVKDSYRSDTIECLDTANKTVTEAKSIRELSGVTQIKPHEIRRALRSGPNWTYKGKAFRYKIEEPWPEEFLRKDSVRSQSVKATQLETGLVLEFGSLRQASKTLKQQYGVAMKPYCREDHEHNGWKFERIANMALTSETV